MRFNRLKALVIAAGVAALALIGNTPATAGTVTTLDAYGAVDFDAACLIGTGLDNGSVPEANNIPTPGAPGGSLGVPPGGSGCEILSTYDGSTAATDLYQLTMDSTPVVNGPSNVQLGAEFLIAGVAPLPGAVCLPANCFDLPNNQFVGAGYKALFQNRTLHRQDNTPTNAFGGGCMRVGTGTPVFDQHGHWLDGYHHFIGIDVVWDGTKWLWSAQVGEYDPSPDGGFFFTELGTATSTAGGVPVWTSNDPNAVFGTHWSVTAKIVVPPPPALPLLLFRVLVDGVLRSANINCATGVFNTVYAKAGDDIGNIKGLTTADSTVALPTTVPLSLVPGFSDLTSVGGFIYFSDITHGNSRNNGTAAVLALATGDNPGTACVHEGLLVNRLCVSYTLGLFGPWGASDTLGDSPACPTPTFGGLLPSNPFFNKFIGCQYDDDNIPVPNAGNPGGPWTAVNPGERGTFLPEWWDTVLQFIA